MKQEIIKYIREIVGKNLQNTEVCTVLSVEGITCTVETVANKIKYEGVRLKAHTEDNKGIVVKPVAGSYVLVSRIDEANYFVSFFSEIEAVSFNDKNGFEVIIENGKMSVKNNSYGIKQAFDELIDAIGKLTVTTGVGPSGIPINKTEFDTIKQKLNNLLS
ncbi:MAG: hypothetical protein LBT56_00030 [Prevotellaceae bacterium]|jgi:hypothetical protein|nr:hypothetical protein [Prevotellaceae bacterium]